MIYIYISPIYMQHILNNIYVYIYISLRVHQVYAYQFPKFVSRWNIEPVKLVQWKVRTIRNRLRFLWQPLTQCVSRNGLNNTSNTKFKTSFFEWFEVKFRNLRSRNLKQFLTIKKSCHFFWDTLCIEANSLSNILVYFSYFETSES